MCESSNIPCCSRLYKSLKSIGPLGQTHNFALIDSLMQYGLLKIYAIVPACAVVAAHRLDSGRFS